MKYLWLCRCLVLAVALAVVKGGLSHPLEKEWQTPLNVGDKVPDVTFATRTRIESDVENPFDWKSKSEKVQCSSVAIDC